MHYGVLSLLGALLYRWRGMSHPYKKYFPRPFNQIAFAAPYAVATGLFYLPYGWWAVIPALAVLGLSTLGAVTGHGRGMDLGDTDKGEPETLEFIVSWLKPYIPLYYYDALFLSVTGLAITLPAGIATLNPILALSGALKGPCYMVAKFGDTGTDGGELLTGAVLWSFFC